MTISIRLSKLFKDIGDGKKTSADVQALVTTEPIYQDDLRVCFGNRFSRRVTMANGTLMRVLLGSDKVSEVLYSHKPYMDNLHLFPDAASLFVDTTTHFGLGIQTLCSFPDAKDWRDSHKFSNVWNQTLLKNALYTDKTARLFACSEKTFDKVTSVLGDEINFGLLFKHWCLIKGYPDPKVPNLEDELIYIGDLSRTQKENPYFGEFLFGTENVLFLYLAREIDGVTGKDFISIVNVYNRKNALFNLKLDETVTKDLEGYLFKTKDISGNASKLFNNKVVMDALLKQDNGVRQLTVGYTEPDTALLNAFFHSSLRQRLVNNSRTWVNALKVAHFSTAFGGLFTWTETNLKSIGAKVKTFDSFNDLKNAQGFINFKQVLIDIRFESASVKSCSFTHAGLGNDKTPLVLTNSTDKRFPAESFYKSGSDFLNIKLDTFSGESGKITILYFEP